MPDRTSGLLKAHVVGRRIYGPSEFRLWTICIVNGPPFWPAKTSGLFGTMRAQSHFRPIKGPCFLWARDSYTYKWPIITEGPNYV